MANALPTRIGTVFLRVANLDAQVTFYQAVLGLKILARTDESATLGAGETPLLQLIHTPEGKRYRGKTGLYHFALLLPERRDLANVLRHFAQHKVPLQGLSDHIVSEAIYLSDPEGNGIEIYCDRPHQAWLKDGQMQLDTVALDVDNLIAELTPETALWSGFPDETVMGHIHLHVRNIAETARFYQETLGLQVMFDMGSAVFLAYDGYHHHIGANVWGGRVPPPEDALGLSHFILYSGSESFLQDPSGNWIQCEALVK